MTEPIQSLGPNGAKGSRTVNTAQRGKFERSLLNSAGERERTPEGHLRSETVMWSALTKDEFVQRRRLQRKERKSSLRRVRLDWREDGERRKEKSLETSREMLSVPASCYISAHFDLLNIARFGGCSRRYNETAFEAAVRAYKNVQGEIEKLVLELKESGPISWKLKKRAALKRKEKVAFELAAKLFAFFANQLGFKVGKRLVYKKDLFDEAMENCFGSINSEGTGVFVYGKIRQEVKTNTDAHRVFSLYLGRKVFVPVSSEKLESALQGFYERITSTPSENGVTPGNKEYARALFDVLFDEPDDSDQILPVHDAGCIELSKGKGGKRAVFYSSDPVYEKDKVEPEAIYTGGKVRVITKDSAFNMKYAFLNRYMNRKVQRNRWCIFGQTVESWLLKNPDFCRGRGQFLSGDLESATDLFNGDFADLGLERLAKVWKLSESDLAQMKSFTTRAKGLGESRVDQRRGQFMGSILSFPILCVLSFIAATWHTNFRDQFMRLYSAGKLVKARNLLRNYGGCGVNGDDVVLKVVERDETLEEVGEWRDGSMRWKGEVVATRTWTSRVLKRMSADHWIQGVESLGGKASRGKSLKNPEFFTVNSELWQWSEKDRVLYEPASIRPSLLLAIAGERRLNPVADWMEYCRSELLVDKTYFNVKRCLRPHMPRSAFGTGVEKGEWDDECLVGMAVAEGVRREKKAHALRSYERVSSQGLVDFQEMAEARREFREKGGDEEDPISHDVEGLDLPIDELGEVFYKDLRVVNGRVRPSKYWEDYEDPFEGQKVFPCYVPRDVKDIYVRGRFATMRPSWTIDDGFNLSVAFQRVEQQVRATLHFMTVGERLRLRRKWEEEWEAQELGLVYAKLPEILFCMYARPVRTQEPLAGTSRADSPPKVTSKEFTGRALKYAAKRLHKIQSGRWKAFLGRNFLDLGLVDTRLWGTQETPDYDRDNQAPRSP